MGASCNSSPQVQLSTDSMRCDIEDKMKILKEKTVSTKFHTYQTFPQTAYDGVDSDVDEGIEEKIIKGEVRKNHRIYDFQEDMCFTSQRQLKLKTQFKEKKRDNFFQTIQTDSPSSNKLVQSAFSHDKELSQKYICLHKLDSEGRSARSRKSILKNPTSHDTERRTLNRRVSIDENSKKVTFAQGTVFKKAKLRRGSKLNQVDQTSLK